MNNFELYTPTKIIFGKDTQSKVGELCAAYSPNKRVLLHYGGGSIKRSGLYDQVVASLQAAGVEYWELGGVQPNPRLSLVYKGIEICREHDIDFILGVGGGSAIDSAKGIAHGVRYDGDVWDFYLKKTFDFSKSLPIGCILTLSATGTEASDSSVVTKEEGNWKRSCKTDKNRPVFAIMNPELTETLPPYQTACGAADMLAHMLERYFTNTPAVDLTDRMLEAGLRTVLYYGPVAYNHPHDYEARAELMFAGMVAHNGLLGMGRQEDWGSHNIGHELSAIYDIAHGASLSIIFPAWMKYVWKINPTRFVQFAQRVMDVDFALEHTERIVLEGIRRLENWFTSIGLPIRLSEVGIDDSRLREMAEKAVTGKALGNFKQMTADDIYEVYKLAL